MIPAFSPLALTQTLSFLPLSQGDVDYQTIRRADPDLIAEAFTEPHTTVILVCDGLVAVPRGQAALTHAEHARMRLATLPGRYAAEGLADAPQAVPIYLGQCPEPDSHCAMAVDISKVVDLSASPADGRGLAGSAEHASPTDSLRARPKSFGSAHAMAASALLGSDDSVFAKAAVRFDWVSLDEFASHASPREVGEAVTAVALGLWHAAQRHCSVCGSAVHPTQAGWAQVCTNPDCPCALERPLFPRIEPAVIVSVVDGQNRILLQHNRCWNDHKLFSVTAGFVEAGENLEHACRREVREETGLELGQVRYLGSQPWPFPASLMVAFKGVAVGGEMDPDGAETIEERFFTREDFRRDLESGAIVVPGPSSIARVMLEQWYGGELPMYFGD
ncbi:NAD+ diphosphatase [Bifidobacterium bohemicum]|uniref:NAD(+) diphosphatase n=1 Tax=Bifidobacterium bohemicum DSM 22767 TaxID=1437606 RepID=A0A086ZGZ7_9BIFI|nr:NAD(+) diphosphatase [Bifidobacterium bohemicum]KFI45797.1 hydrolase, NUDIX family [Bifidobacterium bohemicum DSM 22767]SCC10735.1 NAD+ diphosphatase [Bifidobacterium bohemicum]